MRFGLVARADNSGLGVQCAEIARHLNPHRTLVIDVSHLYNNTTHANKATYLERYPDAMVFNGWQPDRPTLKDFLDGLDVVLTCETPYGGDLLPLARRMGVRSVICPNYEFLDRSHQPDLWAAPSLWHYDEIPDEKIHLPVPIALDRFTPRAKHDGPRHFVHVVGRPAVFDRNGSPDVLAALPYIKSDVKITLKCQDVSYLDQFKYRTIVPPNVELVVDSNDTRDYWDNYRSGDVMLLPRRYGGLSLVANEALGAGMPVVMTDISPNNSWLPAEWLVPASKTAEFMAFNHVDVFAANPIELAAKIDQFCDEDFYAAAKVRADELAQELSWENLRGDYEKVLAG